jgi:hypothetical protein
MGDLVGTYEFEGYATSLDVADCDVEEDARTLYLILVLTLLWRTALNFETKPRLLAGFLTGVSHNCSIEASAETERGFRI